MGFLSPPEYIGVIIMRLSTWLLTSTITLMAPAIAVAQAPATPSAASLAPSAPLPKNYGELARLFEEWRAFVKPPVKNFVADYSAATIAKKAAEFPKYRQRLAAIDRTGWPEGALVDYKLVEGEMNGLDFNLRVLTPWARDPSFYSTVFADWSDVPAHEGPSAYPNIDLYAFKYPLNARDEKTLMAMIAAIPANLQAARATLRDGNAKDLWTYGDRVYRDQSKTLAALADGTLVMRTLDGPVPASIKGAKPALAKAIADARAATDAFADWIAAEAPKKTGQSGVGKDNYNWYVSHVEQLPYSWDEQVVLLQRELDRSISSLRLEELRNADVPPIDPINDPAAYRKMAEAKSAKFSDFLVKKGLASNAPYFRAAIAAQTSDYVPPEQRNFFTHVTALDPLPLLSHSSHWIDLARMKYEPNASPIRRVPPLWNIYANRSEGFATAFEEIVMQAGLYDDIPHGRELVWIMLANRAARGLASLYVQANQMDLAQAGKFHAEWTPRHFSDPNSALVGFEQLLYARQPGYGPSYVTGKLQLDRLIADASHANDLAGKSFVMADFITQVMASGIIPVPFIEAEMLGDPARR